MQASKAADAADGIRMPQPPSTAQARDGGSPNNARRLSGPRLLHTSPVPAVLLSFQQRMRTMTPTPTPVRSDPAALAASRRGHLPPAKPQSPKPRQLMPATSDETQSSQASTDFRNIVTKVLQSDLAQTSQEVERLKSRLDFFEAVDYQHDHETRRMLLKCQKDLEEARESSRRRRHELAVQLLKTQEEVRLATVQCDELHRKLQHQEHVTATLQEQVATQNALVCHLIQETNLVQSTVGILRHDVHRDKLQRAAVYSRLLAIAQAKLTMDLSLCEPWDPTSWYDGQVFHPSTGPRISLLKYRSDAQRLNLNAHIRYLTDCVARVLAFASEAEHAHAQVTLLQEAATSVQAAAERAKQNTVISTPLPTGGIRKMTHSATQTDPGEFRQSFHMLPELVGRTGSPAPMGRPNTSVSFRTSALPEEGDDVDEDDMIVEHDHAGEVRHPSFHSPTKKAASFTLSRGADGVCVGGLPPSAAETELTPLIAKLSDELSAERAKRVEFESRAAELQRKYDVACTDLALAEDRLRGVIAHREVFLSTESLLASEPSTGHVQFGRLSLEMPSAIFPSDSTKFHVAPIIAEQPKPRAQSAAAQRPATALARTKSPGRGGAEHPVDADNRSKQSRARQSQPEAGLRSEVEETEAIIAIRRLCRQLAVAQQMLLAAEEENAHLKLLLASEGPGIAVLSAFEQRVSALERQADEDREVQDAVLAEVRSAIEGLTRIVAIQHVYAEEEEGLEAADKAARQWTDDVNDGDLPDAEADLTPVLQRKRAAALVSAVTSELPESLMLNRKWQPQGQLQTIWMGGRKIGPAYLLITILRDFETTSGADLQVDAYNSSTFRRYSGSCNSYWLAQGNAELLVPEHKDKLSELLLSRLRLDAAATVIERGAAADDEEAAANTIHTSSSRSAVPQRVRLASAADIEAQGSHSTSKVAVSSATALGLGLGEPGSESAGAGFEAPEEAQELLGADAVYLHPVVQAPSTPASTGPMSPGSPRRIPDPVRGVAPPGNDDSGSAAVDVIVFSINKELLGRRNVWKVVGVVSGGYNDRFQLLVADSAAAELLGKSVETNFGSRVEHARALLFCIVKHLFPLLSRVALRNSMPFVASSLCLVGRKIGASACILASMATGSGTVWVEGYDCTDTKLLSGLSITTTQLQQNQVANLDGESMLLHLPLCVSNYCLWLPAPQASQHTIAAPVSVKNVPQQEPSLSQDLLSELDLPIDARELQSDASRVMLDHTDVDEEVQSEDSDEDHPHGLRVQSGAARMSAGTGTSPRDSRASSRAASRAFASGSRPASRFDLDQGRRTPGSHVSFGAGPAAPPAGDPATNDTVPLMSPRAKPSFNSVANTFLVANKFKLGRFAELTANERYRVSVDASRKSLTQHLSAEALSKITAVSAPSQELAALAGMLCLIHDMSPPSWATARRLLMKPDFLERCLNVHPEHVKPSVRATVRDLFSICTGTQHSDAGAAALIEWCGVMAEAPDLGL